MTDTEKALDRAARDLDGRAGYLRLLLIVLGAIPGVQMFASGGPYQNPLFPLILLAIGVGAGAYIADLIVCRIRLAALTALLLVARRPVASRALVSTSVPDQE